MYWVLSVDRQQAERRSRRNVSYVHGTPEPVPSSPHACWSIEVVDTEFRLSESALLVGQSAENHPGPVVSPRANARRARAPSAAPSEHRMHLRPGQPGVQECRTQASWLPGFLAVDAKSPQDGRVI